MSASEICFKPGDLVRWDHPTWFVKSQNGVNRPFQEPCLVIKAKAGINLQSVKVLFSGRKFYANPSNLVLL